jgi:uncharacterized membrane protein
MAERTGRVLLAGETWVMHTIHQKGFDSFTTTEYGEGHGFLLAALEAGGLAVEHLPNHLAARDFPTTREELAAFDAVILSDIGANTLLLHPDTFVRSQVMPNRLALLRDWVAEGGGLVMVGGYLTFNGIEGKGRYGGSPLAEALPVTLVPGDDRVEAPEGATPRVVADHPIVAGLAAEWPLLLGYNKLVAKPEATVVAVAAPAGGPAADPLLAAWTFGRGHAVAFASDCGPHWAPPAFCAWEGYAPLWRNIVRWAAGG